MESNYNETYIGIYHISHINLNGKIAYKRTSDNIDEMYVYFDDEKSKWKVNVYIK